MISNDKSESGPSGALKMVIQKKGYDPAPEEFKVTLKIDAEGKLKVKGNNDSGNIS